MTNDERALVNQIESIYAKREALAAELDALQAELGKHCQFKVGDVLEFSSYSKGRHCVRAVGGLAVGRELQYTAATSKLKADGAPTAVVVSRWIYGDTHRVGTYDFDTNTFTPITETAV